MGTNERSNPIHTFRREFNVGPFDLVDRYGRLVKQGDSVILPQDFPNVIWRVAEVKPDLERRDPRMPQNRVVVSLVVVMSPLMQGGLPATELIKVRDVSEDAPPPNEGEGQEPPPKEQIGQPGPEEPPPGDRPKLVITDKPN